MIKLTIGWTQQDVKENIQLGIGNVADVDLCDIDIA